MRLQLVFCWSGCDELFHEYRIKYREWVFVLITCHNSLELLLLFCFIAENECVSLVLMRFRRISRTIYFYLIAENECVSLVLLRFRKFSRTIYFYLIAENECVSLVLLRFRRFSCTIFCCTPKKKVWLADNWTVKHTSDAQELDVLDARLRIGRKSSKNLDSEQKSLCLRPVVFSIIDGYNNHII